MYLEVKRRVILAHSPNLFLKIQLGKQSLDHELLVIVLDVTHVYGLNHTESDYSNLDAGFQMDSFFFNYSWCASTEIIFFIVSTKAKIKYRNAILLKRYERDTHITIYLIMHFSSYEIFVKVA